MVQLKTYACALALYAGLGMGCESKKDPRVCSEEELNGKSYVECSMDLPDYVACVFPKRVIKSRSLEYFPDQIGKVKVSAPGSSFIDMRYLNKNAIQDLRKDLDVQDIRKLVLQPIENPSGIIKVLGSSKRRVCVRGSY